jgi:hypothetical protein
VARLGVGGLNQHFLFTIFTHEKGLFLDHAACVLHLLPLRVVDQPRSVRGKDLTGSAIQRETIERDLAKVKATVDEMGKK